MVAQSFEIGFLLRQNSGTRHKTRSGVRLLLGGSSVAPVRVHSPRQTASSNLRCLQATESLADLEPDQQRGCMERKAVETAGGDRKTKATHVC